MRIKSSKIALGLATLTATALMLSGCSSDDNESSASETTKATLSVLADGSPISGKLTPLTSGTGSGAPVISVSLPAGWTHNPWGLSGSVTDILSSPQPETSGFTPTSSLSVEKQSTAAPAQILADAHSSLAALDGWAEVKTVDITVDGRKAIRVAGTRTSPDVDVPVYAVMTAIVYQKDESSPTYLVKFLNEFTNTVDLATSNQIEEINTSITFG